MRLLIESTKYLKMFAFPVDLFYRYAFALNRLIGSFTCLSLQILIPRNLFTQLYVQRPMHIKADSTNCNAFRNVFILRVLLQTHIIFHCFKFS